MAPQLNLSVIMPNYNHARFLPESLEAILLQTVRPMEIIIIDDASTDNSPDIINAYAQKEPCIRFIRNEKNMGTLYNATRLLKLATGDYLYGAAADDKIMPGFFEKSMKLLEQNPQAGLCSTLSVSIDEMGKCKGVFPSPVVTTAPRYIFPQECLDYLRKYGSWIKGNTTIYRREALLNAGGYIPELESYTDGFIQQVIALKHGACFIPEPLASLRELPTSFSVTNLAEIEHGLKIMQHAKNLMRSAYRDLFPRDYVRQWERRFCWSTAVSAWYSIRRSQEHYIQQNFTKSGDGAHWSDAISRYILKLSIRLQALVVILHWSLRLKLLGGWLLRRWRKRARSRNFSLPLS